MEWTSLREYRTARHEQERFEWMETAQGFDRRCCALQWKIRSVGAAAATSSVLGGERSLPDWSKLDGGRQGSCGRDRACNRPCAGVGTLAHQAFREQVASTAWDGSGSAMRTERPANVTRVPNLRDHDLIRWRGGSWRRVWSADQAFASPQTWRTLTARTDERKALIAHILPCRDGPVCDWLWIVDHLAMGSESLRETGWRSEPEPADRGSKNRSKSQSYTVNSN